VIVRTLNEERVLVQIGSAGEQVYLRIRDGASFHFTCSVGDLEQVLSGVPLQIAAPGDRCTLARHGDFIRVSVQARERERTSAAFAAEDLREAITAIRAAGANDAP
jgi:hypothetical protein